MPPLDEDDMDADKPIGIFDSGVGGLTVAAAVQRRLPQETLCYFGDTARVPYGTKSPETVIRYSEEITDFLKSHDVKLILAACNTVSSVALSAIEKRFEGPVLGVVEPGVKAALAVTRTRKIGVIGTRSTIASGAYQDQIQAQQPDAEVYSQACPLFVPLAEEGWHDGSVVQETAQYYLQPLKQQGIDTLILGCTHYPLLQAMIQRVMGEGVRLINSAEAAACEVERVLRERQGFNKRKRFKDVFYASDDISHFQALHHRICGNPSCTFTEVNADYFLVAQKIHSIRTPHLQQGIQWFEPLEE